LRRIVDVHAHHHRAIPVVLQGGSELVWASSGRDDAVAVVERSTSERQPEATARAADQPRAFAFTVGRHSPAPFASSCRGRYGGEAEAAHVVEAFVDEVAVDPRWLAQ